MKLRDQEASQESGKFCLRTSATVPGTAAVILLCASETELSNRLVLRGGPGLLAFWRSSTNVPFHKAQNQGIGPGNLHKHSIIRIRHHPEEAELVGILRIESHFHSLDLMA